MRQITRIDKIINYKLIDGEWQVYETEAKSFVENCHSLEECLERLALHRSTATDEKYHIGYDDIALNLEDWEEAWIEQCIIEDKALRQEESDNNIFSLPDWQEWETEEYEDHDTEELYDHYGY